MARLLSAPVRYAEGTNFNQEETDFVVTENFLQGMIVNADPARLPNEALVMAKNVQYSRGLLFRRNGLTKHSIKPDSDQITKLTSINELTLGATFFRFTKSKIYRYSTTGWVEITPSGIAAMSGSTLDIQRLIVADERLFMTNNGADPIREIDIATDTYIALGNADNYRYITAAFNRLVGANLVGSPNVPTQVGWSGDLNYNEWDALVDRSAGYSTIVESPSDTSDEITGIFTNSNALIIPRAQSIWLGTNQAVATNPFKFFSAISGVGADCPRTIQVTTLGLVWFNFQHFAVFAWNYIGEQVELSSQIGKHIKNNVYSPDFTWASYNSNNNEYTLFAASPSSSLVKSWTYNFEYKNWVYEEYTNITETSDVSQANSTSDIDSLSGTIDALSGFIDTLGGIPAGASRVMGNTTGEILVQKDFDGFADQVGVVSTDDDGSAFTTTVDSKIWEIVSNDLFLNSHGVSLIPYTEGTVSLYYSKDDGETWTLSKSVTYTASQLNKAQRLIRKKAIKAERFQWRITTSDCMFALSGAAIRAIKAGESK